MDANKILEAREERALLVNNYIDNYQVVTLHANIPGSNKNIPISYILTNLFHNTIICELKPIAYSYHESCDGPYYIYIYKKDIILKPSLEKLEATSLGRFIDIDCFIDSPKSLNRSNPRRCYLCNDIAFNCIRSQKHSKEELLSYMNKTVKTYLYDDVNSLLEESILKELNLTTKFGLVSPLTSGSHKDMNYDLMRKSAYAIIPYLESMFHKGYEWDSNLDELFDSVRLIGIEAEKAMYKVTSNVNTYQGLIFNLGLIVTNIGYCLSHNEDLNEMFSHCSFMVRNYNHTKGAMKEAFNEYKCIQNILDKYDVDNEDELRYALIELIINVDDSIFNKRCQDEQVRLKVREILTVALKTKDRQLINQHIHRS